MRVRVAAGLFAIVACAASAAAQTASEVVTLTEYERAGHGTEMFAIEPGLEPMMLDWFDAHVKYAPQTPPQ